jgi:hypothetical protein
LAADGSCRLLILHNERAENFELATTARLGQYSHITKERLPVVYGWHR